MKNAFEMTSGGNDVHKTIHDDQFRHSNNIKGITSAICEGFVEYAVEMA
jgi:hypothetical protein